MMAEEDLMMSGPSLSLVSSMTVEWIDIIQIGMAEIGQGEEALTKDMIIVIVTVIEIVDMTGIGTETIVVAEITTETVIEAIIIEIEIVAPLTIMIVIEGHPDHPPEAVAIS